MSDTHRKHDRYHVQPTNATDPRYRYVLMDRETDTPVHYHTTRTAALAACSRLNGRDMTPDQDREEK